MLRICLDTFELPPVVALSSECMCSDRIKCQDLHILIHGMRVSSSGNSIIPIPCHWGINGSHCKFMFWGYLNQQNTVWGIGIQYHPFPKSWVWGMLGMHICVDVSTCACLWGPEVGVGFLS